MALSAIGIPWKTRISAGDEPIRLNSMRRNSIRLDSIRFDSTRKNADSSGFRVDRRREGRAEGREGIVRNIWKIERDWLMRRYLKSAGDIIYIRKLTAKIGMTR